MKYSDLVTPSVMNKLMSYSFKRDGVDISIYRFSKAMDEVFGFIDSQRRKIIERHARVEKDGSVIYKSDEERIACSVEVIRMLEEDVKFEIPIVSLCEFDFDPENHQRPTQKEAWITPIEIRAIIALSEKQYNYSGTNPVPEN